MTVVMVWCWWRGCFFFLRCFLQTKKEKEKARVIEISLPTSHHCVVRNVDSVGKHPPSSSPPSPPLIPTSSKGRTLLNKHGVYIQAVQQGSLRAFDFNSLLIQLTTSLTLFAVATVVTDFCAIYLLPDHEVGGGGCCWLVCQHVCRILEGQLGPSFFL
jgi:hypothetical protein